MNNAAPSPSRDPDGVIAYGLQVIAEQESRAAPVVELAPDADPATCERRERNFAVRAEPSREPDFVGEKTIYTTHNGRQEYPTPLAPHEARKLFDLLAETFGFNAAPAGDPDGEALRLAVKLGLSVEVYRSAPFGDHPYPCVEVRGYVYKRSLAFERAADNHAALEAATRLAIKRAAAEIEKAMPRAEGDQP